MNTTLTTTNIGKTELKSLRMLAKRHGMKQVNYINHCISYFKKTGINPAEQIYSPREEINKLSSRMDSVIRFIKTQEEKKLNPLLDELISISRKLNNQIEEQITTEHLDLIINNLKLIFDCLKNNQDLNKSQMENIYSVLNLIPEKINGSNQILSLIKELHESLYNSLANRSTIGGFHKEDIYEFKEVVSRFNQIKED